MVSHQWNRFRDEEFESEVVAPKSCKYAQALDEWCKNTLAAALQFPDVIRINQSKLRLLDRYFDYYAYVPKPHRECISERSHICIYHVFRHYYNQLRLSELSSNPPLLFIPPEPKIQVVEIDAPDLGDFR